MSRVLLFVQGPGDERPKCVARVPLVVSLYGGAALRDWCTSRAFWSNWHAVECDNAEAGRAFIRDRYMDDAPGRRGECERAILATGGAREGGRE